MRIIKREKQFCISCMEEHEVCTINETTKTKFKGTDIEFDGSYEYCERTDEMWATEEMLNVNTKSLTEAYKKEKSLLTAEEIVEIRSMYDLNQKDLCLIMGWSSNTIGRYESGKVQDEVHNDLLCIIRDNPTWLLEKLNTKRN